MSISYVAASSTITRPADTTAYTSGDLLANSTTAGSVTPLTFAVPWNHGRFGVVRGFTIKKSGTTITNATFTLHLYRSSPVVVNGDNAALSTDFANKIGSIDGAIMVGYSDAGYQSTFGGNFYVDTANTSRYIYGLLEAKAAYTPVSGEIFTVTLVLEQTD